MEFHDPEKPTSHPSSTPLHAVVDVAQAEAGQDPSARHIINRPSQTDFHSSDDLPTDNSSAHVSPDDPDTEPDPEVLVRQPSGPVYSVFSPGMKRWIILVVTFTSFISPMTAVSTRASDLLSWNYIRADQTWQNIYFPALNPIAHDLGVDVSLINLTLTTYMVFQGIAPTIFGDFGDMAGRRPAFIVAVLIYIVGASPSSHLPTCRRIS